MIDGLGFADNVVKLRDNGLGFRVRIYGLVIMV